MTATLLGIKQRFGIIGNAANLNRALDIAMLVAPTDLSVLITGESGSGKEAFPKIIHALSNRKHHNYIAVNCGAIPEGTIDSELFGHEKGAFTGAADHRKGYFEEANKGTIFLDELGELPMSTQARLLRVLESGEFIKVGSSKVLKTDVRIIAATNVKLTEAIKKGKFREDLYYRLNTIPIPVPPLRMREKDAILLFKKFAMDMSEKYHIPPLKLEEDAKQVITNYRWPGNIRQLKNIAEQICILEKERVLTEHTLLKYLPDASGENLPVLFKQNTDTTFSDGKLDEEEFKKERKLFYKVLFDMKSEINDLKKLVVDIVENGMENGFKLNKALVHKIHDEIHHESPMIYTNDFALQTKANNSIHAEEFEDTEEFIEENLSLIDQEKDLIIKALEKNKGKRKAAAIELGISERTLYRKIKEFNIDL